MLEALGREPSLETLVGAQTTQLFRSQNSPEKSVVSGQERGVPHHTHFFGHGAINPQHFQKPAEGGR